MKKVLRILLFVFLGIIVILPIYLIVKNSMGKETVYNIEEVKTGDIENTTVATGKVSPRDEILIKPQISGIITEILKEAGDYVKAGEIIAVVKVIPDVSTLNSAESRLRLAQISLNLVRAEYERQKQLFDKGVIAKEEMDKSETEYKNAQEEIRVAKDNLDIVKTGISKSTAKYSNTQIRATIDGMILDIPVKVGNSVIQANTFNDGTTIASIANMNDMIFIGKIDETEVGRVKLNMPMKLTVGAIDSKKFDAVLEYIAPKGSEENGAVLFEIKAAARIPEDVHIRAGYSANAEIVLEKAANILTLPESTISFSNDSAFVYIVTKEKPKQEFEKRHVTLGMSDGVNMEIKSGVKSGEKVRGTEIDSNEKKTIETEL
jgi:HlyD family secretion protein